MNNMKKEQLRLYAVTDRTWLGNETLYEQVEKALEGGATLVQLREKELPEADVQKEAEELLELCHRYGVKLILDDDVELAAKVGADGVHIGQSDMELAHAREILGPDKIIGVTAKTVEQAKAAEAGGADYLGSGAVFGSTTKIGKTLDQDGKPVMLLETYSHGRLCSQANSPLTRTDEKVYLKVEGDNAVNYTFSYSTSPKGNWTQVGDPASADLISTQTAGVLPEPWSAFMLQEAIRGKDQQREHSFLVDRHIPIEWIAKL